MGEYLGKKKRLSRGIHIGVSEEEWGEFMLIYKSSGCDSITNFIRLVINQYAGREIMAQRACNNMYVKRDI